MVEDNKLVKSIEAKIGGKSGTYWRVTWQDGKADNIFNKDWLPLLEQSQKENRLIHFAKDKKGGSQYYNIVSLELANLPTVEPTHLKPDGSLESKTPEAGLIEKAVLGEMTKDDWAEKDRITRKSIERQVALKEAVALAAIKGLDDARKVVATAKLFEAYLEGNELVEEAKKLLEK